MNSALRVLAVVAFGLIGVAARAGDESGVEARAADLLEEIAAGPDSGIPAPFLADARAITVLPHVVETRAGIGRMRGRGLHLRRDEDGTWGEPRVVEVSERSVGPEAGRSVSDRVILYLTRDAAERGVTEGRTLRFSLEASGAFRPRHRFRGPRVGDPTGDGALVYVRERGVRIGAAVGVDHKFSYALVPPPEPAALPAAPGASALPAPAPPETARLRAALATLTGPPRPRSAPEAPADHATLPAGFTPAPAVPARIAPAPR